MYDEHVDNDGLPSLLCLLLNLFISINENSERKKWAPYFLKASNCYRSRDIAWSLCVGLPANLAKTAEPIEMSFGVQTRMDHGIVLDGVYIGVT